MVNFQAISLKSDFLQEITYQCEVDHLKGRFAGTHELEKSEKQVQLDLQERGYSHEGLNRNEWSIYWFNGR